jgi:hypothetical protein
MKKKERLFNLPQLRQTLLFMLLLSALMLLAPEKGTAEELELINRPVNTAALTGLLFTTSPFTLPSGVQEIGLAGIAEKSTIPEYTLNELPIVTVTAGMSRAMEIGLQSTYFYESEKDDTKKRGFGDTTLSYKWNFLPQRESSAMPALALLVSGIAATSSDETNFSAVINWGAKFGLAAGREIIWGDHVIGLYADGQLVIHDLSKPEYRDRYGIINAGLLFPISKYRNLQMLVEYTIVTGIDRLTDIGGDYSGITSGLRLVSERFNLSIGTQFVHKSVPDSDFSNSTKVIGMISIKI